MDYFDRTINGRRVVFVGPAATLHNQKQKTFIDSFDVVIKTNGLVFINPMFYDDYSDRCDILYINQSYLDHTKLDVSELLLLKIEIICVKSLNKINPQQLSPIPVRVVRNIFCNQNFLHAPTMGSIIVNDVLSSKPKSLHLMGMDFYTNDIPYIETYQPIAIDDLIKQKWHKITLNTKKVTQNKKVLHNINEDFRYIYKMYKRTNIITVDPYIQNLFNDLELALSKV